MKKLHRIALVASVLAFGVAACGDDVTVVEPTPPPPPALVVSLSPANATAKVGEVTDFAVGVSGGADGASASWTCASSNNSVATVATTATGCRATAVAAGSASVTATVTKGTQSSNAGAQLVVTAPPVQPDPVKATVTIATVTKGGLTQPVDIDNVMGQIDVTVNVNPNDQVVTSVSVFVDGVVAATQNITPGSFELVAGDDTAEALQQVTLSFNTAQYAVNGNAATPRYLNGLRQIQAKADVAGATDPAASNVTTLRFNNTDGFHVRAAYVGNTAVDANARFWIGGPTFAIDVTPIPVMYSGRVVTHMAANLQQLATASPSATQRCEVKTSRAITTPDSLTFDYNCKGTETDSIIPVVTTVVAPGNTGPAIGINGAGILNLASTDHPFPARIDVKAPVGGSMAIVRDTVLNNTGNWINSQYNFATGFSATGLADAGVGLPDSATARRVFAVSDLDGPDGILVGPASSLTGADLGAALGANAETVTNEEYIAWAAVLDRLGNLDFRQQIAATDHPATTFGYDNTVPAWNFVSDSTIVIENFDNNVALAGGVSNHAIAIQASDIAAGFNTTYAGKHAIVSARGTYQGNGAITTAAIVGTSAQAAPFARAAAGQTIARLASIAGTDFIGQTALEFEAPYLFGNTPSFAARYYIYQVRIQDQAGNFVIGNRSWYKNNGSIPEIEFLEKPSTYDGNATFRLAVAEDSVEIAEASLEIKYPNTLGTVVWERPTAGIRSILRMNAGVLDGTLFNDVIYRPQYQLSLPLGLSALGLPFLKGIQGVNGDFYPDSASIATAKPDSVRARIFNGFGASDELYNHSTAAPMAVSGISAYESRVIRPEEITGTLYNYYNFKKVMAGQPTWTYRITDRDQDLLADSIVAFACPADSYCVRTVGPKSTFENPFAGGPVLVVAAEISEAYTMVGGPGTGVNGELQWRVIDLATANFNNPFPTRDNGDDRIYEWRFKLPEGISIETHAIAAVGLRAGTETGLVTVYEGDYTPPPPPPPPVDDFQPTFGVPQQFSGVVEGLGTSTNRLVLGRGNSPQQNGSIAQIAIGGVPATRLASISWTLLNSGSSAIALSDFHIAQDGETLYVRLGQRPDDSACLTVSAPPVTTNPQPNELGDVEVTFVDTQGGFKKRTLYLRVTNPNASNTSTCPI